jgi:peptide/nickel transport system substrate-binding protein
MDARLCWSMLAAVLFGCVVSSAPSHAQKAKDTVRIGITDPIASILLYDDPQPEIGLLSQAVFDPLICYNARKGQFDPLLAASWTVVDEHTLEFRLRSDVKFHDGSDFDADDVIYTLDWLVDPATEYRFKENFDWVDRVEKIDRYGVRIKIKKPPAIALLRLAIGFAVLPSARHRALANKSEFGRKTPIGTGPYRAELVDANQGVVLVRNERYPQGNGCRPAARIGRAHAVPIPDMQTQIAQLVTGGLDVTHVPSKDLVDLLGTNPNLRVTANQAITFHYMAIDSINRSGNAALANLRVRQAIVKSIDRELVARNVVPGDDAVEVVDAVCIRAQRGCDFSTKPLAYDPAAAKQLLAEAGYPDGFDVEITANPGAYSLAEAIAGEMRKIGIRPKVDKVTFVAYRQRQREGKIQLLVGQWTSGGFPDASSNVDFYFDKGARDYWRDPFIEARAAEASTMADEGRRKAIYRELFDRVNEMSYILPLSTKPDVFVHGKDVFIAKGSLSVYGADINEMEWR